MQVGRRTGVQVVRREAAASRDSPNATVPQITVEVRVHWPPGMSHEPKVCELVALVAQDAITAVLERYDGQDITVTTR